MLYRPHLCAVLIIVVLLLGCNGPIAPSVSTGGPIAVTWYHLTSEQWRYKLESETTITEYGFDPAGLVSCTIGSHNIVDPVYGDEPTDIVHGIVCEWKILKNGDLMILDDADGNSHTVLRLTGLTRDSATALDVATNKFLHFSRTYTER
ncbi:hypothetical protein SH528x_003168 [Novipirellula sp. SH528]|uniref:hypothetical protein n=1 Tax=Novipirellula sp. SH528 TaxID=3454466 RepID=UPI003FA0F526